MAKDNTVEIIEAMSKAMADVAKAVGEGIGKGIAEALGYNRPIEIIQPKEEEEEPMFFPDVERGDPSGWIQGDPNAVP
jgi:hypothetical protein